MLYWWQNQDFADILAQQANTCRLLLVHGGSVDLRNDETGLKQHIAPGEAHVTYAGISLALETITKDATGWLIALDKADFDALAQRSDKFTIDGEKWRAVGPWHRKLNNATFTYLSTICEHAANRADEAAVQKTGIEWAMLEFWRCWWLAEELNATGRASPLTAQAISRIQATVPPPRGPALARELQVSADHLARVFKRDMGMSIDAYRDWARVELALKLIQDKKMDLHALALEVGFGSYAPFYRAFRKVVGLSPSSWLKRSPIDKT